MKPNMRKLLTMIHAASEIIVDQQREKALKDYPITIMALAISSMCRWGIEQLEKEEAPEDPR
jgi:hypothetical protein